MKQLGSSEYKQVKVILRDDNIIMPAETGTKLMEYLTSNNTSSHVMITDVTGNQIVVNKSDIRRVTPMLVKTSNYKTAEELGLVSKAEARETVSPDRLAEQRS